MDDLPLYERLATDPVTMAELGGPLPREGLSDKLRGIVEDVEAGRVWYCAIVPDGQPAVGAGMVCIWNQDWEGEPINEIGWMVLPPSREGDWPPRPSGRSSTGPEPRAAGA